MARVGADLTTPASMSGVTPPAARATTVRSNPVTIAGLAIGNTTCQSVSALVMPGERLPSRLPVFPY